MRRFFVLLLLPVASVRVAAQPADTLRARAERAIAAGNGEAARAAAQALVSQQRRRADAHVLLARARLTGPAPDPRGAHGAVTEALLRDRRNADALALRLALERRGIGLGGLPIGVRRQQRRDTGTRLLALDSARTPALARALALLDAGEQALDAFAFEQHRIAPRVVAPRGRPDDSRFDLARMTDDGIVPDFRPDARRAADEARDRLTRAYRLATDRAIAPLAGLPRPGDLATAAADALARFYARSGETNALLRLAWGERRRRPADAAPWRWQGLALYESGQVEPAAAAFDSARVRLSPDERAALDDLARIARPADLDRFTATDDATDAYWAAADPRRLTEVNERRVEHEARLALADLTLGEGRADAATADATAGRDTERGRVLVRYGRPVRRATISQRSRRSADPQYELFEVWEYEQQRFVFAAVTRESPYELYTPPAYAYRVAPERARVDDYVMRHRELVQRSPEETTYAPRARVAMGVQVAAFRADDARVDLAVGLALPLTAAEREAWTGGAVSIALLRDGERLEAEHRRTFDVRPDSSLLARGSGALWLHAETLRVRPGRYRLRVEAQTANGPVGMTTVDLTAPVYERRFAVSDVLLAYHVTTDTATRAPGDILRRGRALRPAGDAAFERAVPFYTVFEVYGLTRDASGATGFDIEATMAPEQRGGQSVTTNFAVTGRATTEAYAGRLDASSLPPGRVRLTLRIRDRVSGQTVETARTLTLF